jgi:hypothetical protein
MLAALLAALALSCGHVDAPAPQAAPATQAAAPEKQETASVQPAWRRPLEEKNRRYVLDTLGAEGEDPWFSGIPRDGAFYYVAVSGKTTAEHRSRARAQEEARRLAREYYREVTGAEPDPQTGRGLEVVRWKIITGTTEGGPEYYIACALVRLPEQWPGR